jgi:xanthine dehydrogenase accessory factor
MMREIFGTLAEALERDRPCVYCAVVQTRGSTPQKAGAVMLVHADGGQTGTLGGGCVEAEVKRRALAVLAGEGQGTAEVLTFCLDDNYGWDDGLICGGRMSILADPVVAARCGDYYRQFRSRVDTGAGCVEAVVLDGAVGLAPGSRYLFDECGGLLAALGGEPEAPEAIRRGLPDLARRPGPSAQGGVAYLPVLPRVALLIVGGGHVGQAVARLAAEVDFDVDVVDDRASYLGRDRFPAARNLIAGAIGPTLQRLVPTVGPSTYCLIVTRGHAHDEEALFHLAGTKAGYVGMIGSKRKIRLIYEDLEARGVPAEALARVHAPLGFDIGSQTVPEIAVSIVAELIAARNLGSTAPRPQVRPQPGRRAAGS